MGVLSFVVASINLENIKKGWWIIGAFLVLVIIVVYVIPAIINASKFSKLPEIKARVKVVDKRLKAQETIHNVTFELQDGRKIVFDLPDKQYKSIFVGASGILTYKETENKKKDKFLSFAAEQESPVEVPTEAPVEAQEPAPPEQGS